MARDDRANGATATNAVGKMNFLETVQASRCTRGSRIFDWLNLLVDTRHSHLYPPFYVDDNFHFTEAMKASVYVSGQKKSGR